MEHLQRKEGTCGTVGKHGGIEAIEDPWNQEFRCVLIYLQLGGPLVKHTIKSVTNVLGSPFEEGLLGRPGGQNFGPNRRQQEKEGGVSSQCSVYGQGCHHASRDHQHHTSVAIHQKNLLDQSTRHSGPQLEPP